MYFFKVLISTILLKTVLHKGRTQDLQCIHGERNIYSALWTEYMNVFKTMQDLPGPEKSVPEIIYMTERVITTILENVLRDESENENPDELCLKATRHCPIYEEPIEYVTVTAEGLQKIEDVGGDVLLTPELYPSNLPNFFRIILKSLTALKCKVQISNVPRNNVHLNDVPLNEVFANMTVIDDIRGVPPNELVTNRVATNGVVTTNGITTNNAPTSGVATNHVVTNGAPDTYGFSYYGILFTDPNFSDTDSIVSDYSDADPPDATFNNPFYFLIFLFRRESKYPMFIFHSRSQNNYFPTFQIQIENEGEEPNDINNTINSTEHI